MRGLYFCLRLSNHADGRTRHTNLVCAMHKQLTTAHGTVECRVCMSCVATATPHTLEIGSCTRPPSKRARTERVTRGNGNESRFKPSALRSATVNVQRRVQRQAQARRARHSASDRHTANHPIPICEYMHTTCTTNMQHPHPHPHAHAHAHAHHYTTSVQANSQRWRQ